MRIIFLNARFPMRVNMQSIAYGKSRAVAFVETDSDSAAQDNLDNNTLLKAVK